MGFITDMRTKLLLMPLVMCITLFTVFACDNDEVSIGQEFSLQIGESASIRGEELQISFLEVTEDSRCPKDVTCVWEGRVSCMVEITYRESLHRIILTEPGSTSWPAENFQEYKIAYHVEPYPQTVAKITENEYHLFLSISK